jgi:hypothetical protein
MLDDVVRGRRGASLFRDGEPTTLGTLWAGQIRNVGDADVATQAVVDLFTTTPFEHIPTPSDYKAAVRKIRADRRLPEPAEDLEWKREMPRWAKGWLVARFIHRDPRSWPEQRTGFDALLRGQPYTRTYVWADQEEMPPEAREQYETEGEALSADRLDELFAKVGSHE